MRMSKLTYLSALLLVLPLAACSDVERPPGAHTGTGGNDEVEPPEDGLGGDRDDLGSLAPGDELPGDDDPTLDDDPSEDNPIEDDPTEDRPDGWEDPELTRERLLTLAGDNEISLVALEDASLRVRLVDGYGRPVVGESVDFWLMGHTRGSTLASANEDEETRLSVRTNEGGYADARITAGDDATEFEIRIKHPASPELTVDVEVTAFPEGDLVVSVTSDDDDGLLETIELELREARDELDEAGCPLPRRSRVVADAAVDGSEGEVRFQDLPTGKTYRVDAVGLAPDGLEIAAGCGSAGPIEGLKTVDAEIEVILFPISFAGDPAEFDVTARIDLATGLSESVLGTLDELSQALAQPASFFVRPISNRVPQDFGAPVLPAGFARRAIYTAAGLALDSYFRSNVGDPAFDRFPLAAAELLPILGRTGVRSHLRLSGTADLPELTGVTHWRQLVLTSQLFCNEDAEEGCETRIVSLAGRAKLGVRADLEATWDGGEAYDTDAYTLDVDFRELFHVVFNDNVLPAILDDPDATSVAAVMERLADCGRIGDLISSFLGDPILEGLLSGVTAGLCRDGIHGWGAGIDDEIAALDGSESQLQLEDTARVLGTDTDRVLDTFEDGAYTGRWIFDGVAGDAFGGTFTATSR